MGHGQVRCGKCRRQFDAIECMLDEEDVSAPTSPPTAPQPSAVRGESRHEQAAPAPRYEQPIYAEDVVMEGSRIEISGTYRIADGVEMDAAHDKVIREHIVIDRGGPVEEIATTEEESTAGEHEPLALDDEDERPIADEIDDPTRDDASATENRDVPPVPRRWQRLAEREREDADESIALDTDLDALTRRERPRVLRTGVWTGLCIVFGIVLMLQIVHHNRDALVRSPSLGNTVSRLYHLFGLSPTPHWDLSAYKWDIYKVGLDPKIPDALRVVGSVANDAQFSQPYPLGKLSLQDRWGGAVGERAFEPYEYLPAPEAADRLMAPKQRANIEIVIADPGTDAVGYVINACLEQDRHLICADQLPVFK
jgi:hypothetical protein